MGRSSRERHRPVWQPRGRPLPGHPLIVFVRDEPGGQRQGMTEGQEGEGGDEDGELEEQRVGEGAMADRVLDGAGEPGREPPHDPLPRWSRSGAIPASRATAASSGAGGWPRATQEPR